MILATVQHVGEGIPYSVLILLVQKYKMSLSSIPVGKRWSHDSHVTANMNRTTLEYHQCYTHLWNSHSLLSRGHTCRVLSQREMQWKWKAWLHTPQATVHSSLVAEAWLAWHSIPTCTVDRLGRTQTLEPRNQFYFTSNCLVAKCVWGWGGGQTNPKMGDSTPRSCSNLSR